MSDLKSRLIRSAESWAAAHDCGVTRIGKRVAGDANFFTRLDSPDATCNVATLEKFGRFLADGANWPDGRVPGDVVEFIHVLGITAAEAQDHG